MWIFLSLLILTTPACKEEDAHSGHYVDLTADENLDSLLANLNENTANTIVSSQPTVKVTKAIGNQTIKATGFIGFDERRNNTVSARISGRIEELFVRYENQYIRKGEPVLALYSPELNTFMEQHILLSTSEQDREMLKLSRKKLLLLGMTESQINQIEKQRKPLQKVTFYSPYEGFIRFGNSSGTESSTEKMPTETGMDGMGAITSKSAGNKTNAELQPGSYINEGLALFTVNDLTQVWALLSVPTEYLLSLQTKMPLKLKIEGIENEMDAKIDFIEPVFSNDGKFGKVRAYLPNPQKKIKFNALVSAEISTIGNEILTVPNSAVYSLGMQKIVWVKAGTTATANVFTARFVTAGAEINGKISITSGLSAEEEVAENASYLVDSEGQIQVK